MTLLTFLLDALTNKKFGGKAAWQVLIFIFIHLCHIAARTAVLLPSNLDNREVSDMLLHDLVEDLSTSWKMLGRRLGIPEGAITNIDIEHRRVVEKGMAMFAEWKRRKGEGATVRALREALDKTGRRDLSERVRGTCKVDLVFLSVTFFDDIETFSYKLYC